MQEHMPERFATSDAGLDRILQGGLLKHGMHVLAGLPGTGKTVLAQQIGFHAASQGHQVVTVTALAESHERLLSHMSRFAFFNSTLVGSKVYYLSASRLFIEQGLLPSLHELRQLISSPRAEVLIFEGLSAVGNLAASEIDFRRFLFELNTHLMLMSCMGLFIADTNPHASLDGPEYALADTVMLLHRREQAQRHIRELEVIKSRGVEALMGRHTFEIGDKGITAYPRLEAVEGRARPIQSNRTLTGVGLPQVDILLDGGVPHASVTLVLGAPGTGKSLLGAHFIAEGAQNNEPGLIWSFQSSADDIIDQAAGIGLKLSHLVEDERVTIRWRPPLELLIDKEFYLLLQTIEERGIKRLLIDPFNPFSTLAAESGRSFDILTALANTLRARGVTTIVTMEIAELLGLRTEPQSLPPPGAVDNHLLLRYEQREGRLVRSMVALKKRKGGHTLAPREYSISDQGFVFP